jgi:hypothetical protein
MRAKLFNNWSWKIIKFYNIYRWLSVLSSGRLTTNKYCWMYSCKQEVLTNCNISYYIDAHEILTFPSEWKNSISSSEIKTLLVWHHRSKVHPFCNEKVASLEIVFDHTSEIWSDKRGGFWRDGPYERGTIV